MNLSTAAQGFLLDKQIAGCSPNTIRNYTGDLRRLRQHLDPLDPDLSDITTDQLKTFFTWLITARFTPGGIVKRPPQRLSPKTIRNIHTTLCSLWTWAIGEGYTHDHLPRQIQVPKPEPPDIQPFTFLQIQRLIEATYWSRQWATSPETQSEIPRRQQLRDRALILFLLDTGVRASELCRLCLRNVDLQTGTASVIGKGRLSGGEGKPRTVQYCARTTRALWTYLADRNVVQPYQPAAHLFVTKQGTELDRSNLRRHLNALGKRAGVPKCHPHRFRHTFATNYLRNGGDIYSLQNLLGHTSLEMVRRYLHLTETDTASAHRRASPVDNWKL